MIKTLNLTANAEISIGNLGGDRCRIQNRTSGTLYVSDKPGITPCADGVMSIPSGRGDYFPYSMTSDTVYLLSAADGNVEVSGEHYYRPFDSAAGAGGEEWEVDSALSSISTNPVQNKVINASLSEKADKTAVINENLLIDPDFNVNHTGKTAFTSAGKTIDCWSMGIGGSGNTGSFDLPTKVLTCGTKNTNGYYTHLHQWLQNPEIYAGMKMTFSAKMSSISEGALLQIWRQEGDTTTSLATSGYSLDEEKSLTFTMPSDITSSSKVRVLLQTRGSAKLEWAKLEVGSMATAFVPPNRNIEEVRGREYNAEPLLGFKEWSSGDIKELVLNATTFGDLWITNGVTGMPNDGTWWFGHLTVTSTGHRQLVVRNIDNTVSYVLKYNSGSKKWSDWVNLVAAPAVGVGTVTGTSASAVTLGYKPSILLVTSRQKSNGSVLLHQDHTSGDLTLGSADGTASATVSVTLTATGFEVSAPGQSAAFPFDYMVFK